MIGQVLDLARGFIGVPHLIRINAELTAERDWLREALDRRLTAVEELVGRVAEIERDLEGIESITRELYLGPDAGGPRPRVRVEDLVERPSGSLWEGVTEDGRWIVINWRRGELRAGLGQSHKDAVVNSLEDSALFCEQVGTVDAGRLAKAEMMHLLVDVVDWVAESEAARRG